MAEELWNRVNIPFPGAVSSVRVHFTSHTDALVENVLLGIETVLQLLDSEVLQTEIRVLYELLYILNNSYRGNKSYKGLKQVEQCVNRLKDMKLVEALYELTEMCPNKVQRNVGKKARECTVPSQPMLEWLCLKVLGAAHLMNCTLQRCTRAFLLCNQQMKWEEFLVLNVVLTSMLSRLWVIFRGVLVSLSTLYESLLGLCREVAEVKPMPFLDASSLPPNMSELLDPELLYDQTCKVGVKKQKEEPLFKTRQDKRRPVKNVTEDVGVSIKRDRADNLDLKPFVNIFNTFTKQFHPNQKPESNGVEAKKKSLKTSVKMATSFSDIYESLDNRIQWCKRKRLWRQRSRFLCLRLKCQKMRSLENEGYNVQKKLNNFRCEVFRACSKNPLSKSNRPNVATSKKKVQPRSNLQPLRSHLKCKSIRMGYKKKRQVKEKSRKSKAQKRCKDKGRRTEDEAIPQSSHCDRRDDIDDIFSSIGL